MKTNLLRTSYFVPLYIFLFLCTFFGCKKGNTPETLQGSTEKPAWTAPANYDLASSMTAVIKVDLSSCYTAEQLETTLRSAGFSEVTSDHHPTKPWITVIARK